MAKTLQIACGSTSVNLLTEFILARGGFSYRTSEDLVWTVFEVVSDQADATFRSKMETLDKLKVLAVNFIADSNESEPCYLNWAAEGETVRRTVVHDIWTETLAGDVITPMLGRDVAVVRIAVLHSPIFEETASVNPTQTGISTTGGTWSIGNDGGSYPQRISVLKLDSASVGDLSKFWIGIRKLRYGTAGFISTWQAEDGTNILDAADTADGGASGGSKVTISFATSAAMAKRFALRWDQVQTSPTVKDDIIGTYLMLARCKLSAGTVEVAIDMRHGWAGFSGAETSIGVTYLSAVTDSNLTNWNLIPLGVVQIPPTGNRDSRASLNDEIGNYHLVLYAERLSASGSLDVDCFLMIPAEHLAVIDGAQVGSTGGPLTIYSSQDEVQYALGRTAASGNFGNVEYEFDNFVYPIGGGLLVLAAQGASEHLLSRTCDLDLTLKKRWLSYRS